MKKVLLKKDFVGEWYAFGECVVCVSIDNGYFHISISHDDRLPTYEEVKEARYEFAPDDIHMAMIFPPKKEFVNLHNYCFHLWQISKKKI